MIDVEDEDEDEDEASPMVGPPNENSNIDACTSRPIMTVTMFRMRMIKIDTVKYTCKAIASWQRKKSRIQSFKRQAAALAPKFLRSILQLHLQYSRIILPPRQRYVVS